MICVSIGRGRHRHMIAEHRHLVEQGAQLVELRVDYINGDVGISRLLRDRPCPVILTCRREKDGGKYTGSEESRLMMIRTAIGEGVDYIDLEDDIADKIPRFGKTKRIISYHNFNKTPSDLAKLHAKLSKLDPDIIKIATIANDPHDNIRMLKLSQEGAIPTVAICMGDIGTPSRILAGRFGAPFTYATFHQERAMAPGQLSYQQMTEIYHYEKINRETLVFGVIADPIGHSMSPHIHNAAFASTGKNAVYVPFRVPRTSLKRFISEASSLGIEGLSVTIPHKEAVMPLLSEVDKSAKGIGAVNTVCFKGNTIKGYNTDCKAALDSLVKVMPPSPNNDSPLKNKTVLILGAGGAARSITYGLRNQGATVVIANRTLDRSEALAKEFSCKTIEWDARYMVNADIVINCTPIGMHPNVDETPYSRRHLKPSMIVFDTVYNPESTLLVKEARNQNCRVVTGVEMFVRQAAFQYQLFSGEKPPMDVMRDELKRAIGPVRY